MTVAVLYTRALSGVDAPVVTVEVHLGNGLPSFQIVGLPEAEVREARDRVRAALQTARYKLPPRRITVNLAPADLPKESGRFDLPIALGILVASEQLAARDLHAHEFAGELALTGALRAVRGALPMARAAHRAGRAFVLPAASAPEASLVAGARVLPAPDLLAVCGHLSGTAALAPLDTRSEIPEPPYPDLRDVRGQPQARRALEVAAAGGHSLLLVGPPGTGKSMLAERLPGILPPLSDDEALAAASVRSLASGGFDAGRWRQRVVRAPHHSATAAALVGGGAVPRPGEISLAHYGVLFLDELPEFRRGVLEVLREPLETGRIVLSRAGRQAEFPARFQLVAAMNPCPCGYLDHPEGRCRCSAAAVARYRARLSGPLLDRIDLHVEMPPLAEEAMLDQPAGEASAPVRARVARARARQSARQGCCNAHLAAEALDASCALSGDALALVRQAVRTLELSMRSLQRIRRVARTIADLDDADGVGAGHVAAAVALRRVTGFR
jgi:magnesium chelatase family protein